MSGNKLRSSHHSLVYNAPAEGYVPGLGEVHPSLAAAAPPDLSAMAALGQMEMGGMHPQMMQGLGQVDPSMMQAMPMQQQPAQIQPHPQPQPENKPVAKKEEKASYDWKNKSLKVAGAGLASIGMAYLLGDRFSKPLRWFVIGSGIAIGFEFLGKS